MKAKVTDFIIGCLPFLAPVIVWAVFLGLKLVGQIGWRWIWVFSPLWLELIVMAVIGLWLRMSLKNTIGWGDAPQRELVFVPFGSYPLTFHGRTNAFRDALALQKKGKRVRMRNTDQAFIVEVEDVTT